MLLRRLAVETELKSLHVQAMLPFDWHVACSTSTQANAA